jgi:hypothetical protein
VNPEGFTSVAGDTSLSEVALTVTTPDKAIQNEGVTTENSCAISAGLVPSELSLTPALNPGPISSKLLKCVAAKQI